MKDSKVVLSYLSSLIFWQWLGTGIRLSCVNIWNTFFKNFLKSTKKKNKIVQRWMQLITLSLPLPKSVYFSSQVYSSLVVISWKDFPFYSPTKYRHTYPPHLKAFLYPVAQTRNLRVSWFLSFPHFPHPNHPQIFRTLPSRFNVIRAFISISIASTWCPSHTLRNHCSRSPTLQ